MSFLHPQDKYWLRFYLISFLLLTGCAHTKSSSDGSNPLEDLPAPKTLTEVLTQDVGREQGSKRSSQKSIVYENGELIVQGIKLKNTQFDIPITINSRVESWIDYFCGRGRKYFSKYLDRSEYFIPYIRPLLKQNNLPEDLVYLAMIESGFNNLARSHAKAVGPWQFISATGKRYGLRVNWWVDERRDIRKSTMAAVGYLGDLYRIFQSWELAAASYNAGEAKVARAVRRYGTKDFWTIAKQKYLKPETRDYVPKIIAAAIIAKNRTQFGFPESALKPGVGEAVSPDGELVKLMKSDKPTDENAEKVDKDEAIQQVLESDDEEFASSNEDADSDAMADTAELKPASGTISLDAGVVPHPQDSERPSMPLAMPVPTPYMTKSSEVGGEQLAEFEVQSPADLLKIARAAGLSYQTVKALNPEVLRWCTPPNSGSYRIKLPSSIKEKFLATYNHQAYPRKVQFMSYKVRRGDTLTRIARQFGIKVDPMSDLNGVPTKMPLRAGSKVLLPVPNDRSRTFASLEVRDPPEKRRSRRRHRNKYYKLTYKHRESTRSVKNRGTQSDEG
jgi:LysM repeat protein